MAFLATSLLSVNSQTVVETFGRLQTTTTQKNGKEITIVGAENGTPISLAGMSTFWTIAGDSSNFFNAQSLNHLSDDWNISLIRVAMGVNESWDNGNGYADGANGRRFNLDKVEPLIDAAIAKGIYVIVDFHSHDAQNYLTEAKEFFGYMSNKYGDIDNIIYEIYNEPIGDQNNPANLWNNSIKPYAEEVITTIRANDPDNLIIVGTPFFSQRVDIASQNKINDPNIAYTLHFYAGALLDNDPSRPDPNHRDEARRRTVSAMNNGAAIFVTEWGTVDSDGDGNFDPNQSDIWLDFLKNNHISHANWALSDKSESASVVNPGQGVNGLLNNNLTTPGNYIRDAIKEIAEDQTLSTENFNLNGEAISVYPNPAADRMTISTKNTPITSVKIIDMQGREVLKNNYKSTKATIDVSALSKGLYVLQLNNKTSRKIIIE